MGVSRISESMQGKTKEIMEIVKSKIDNFNTRCRRCHPVPEKSSKVLRHQNLRYHPHSR